MCYSSAGRVCVAIIIIALVLIGMCFCLIGIFPIRETVSSNYKELSTTTQNVRYFALASGLLALIVCSLSLCGICVILWYTESRCLFSWLALLVVLAIIIDIVLIVQVEMVKSQVRDFLEEKMNLYGISPVATNLIDFYQKKFHCCGVDGPEDYTSSGLSIPASCCPLPDLETDQTIPGTKGQRAQQPFIEDTPFQKDSDRPKFKRSIPNAENQMSEKLQEGNNFTNNKGIISEEEKDSNYKINLTARVEFDLPPKNVSEMGPVGSNKPGGIGAGGLPCKGCYSGVLDNYETYFIIFYVLIAAKILLEFTVGVSPCWLMLREKLDNLHGQPYNGDGASYDTVDRMPCRR